MKVGCPTVKRTGGGESVSPQTASDENWGPFFCPQLIIINMKISEKIFPIILGLSALFVAVVAAVFSIMGIGMLFSGAQLSSMIMAASLELGKLTATTFLYRYWKTTTGFLKTYLVLAIVILMFITSLGVFGWLSAAYQTSSIKYEVIQQQVGILTEQKSRMLSDADRSKKRTESLSVLRAEQEIRFGETIKNPTLSRNPTQMRQIQDQNLQLMKETDASIAETQKKYDGIMSSISDTDNKINEIKLDTTKTKDMITFKFIADAFGVDMTVAVKWFIATIIAVFDPLAVCLILAYNVATFSPKKESIVIESVEEVEIPKEAEKLVMELSDVIDNIQIPTSVSMVNTAEPIVDIVTKPKNTTSSVERKLHPSEYYSSPTR